MPIGLSLFAFLNYRLTGDFLAFSHIQQTGWGHEWTNPFSVLLGSLVDGDPLHFINGIFSITAVVVLSAGPDAFLRIDRAVIITASSSKEDVLELGHPGIGEE